MYVCTVLRLRKPSSSGAASAGVIFGSCTVTKLKASPYCIVLESRLGSAGSNRCTLCPETVAAVRRYDDTNTFGTTEHAFLNHMAMMWSDVIKPAAESLTSPLSGVWSDEDYCCIKCECQEKSFESSAAPKACEACSAAACVVVKCMACGHPLPMCLKCGSGASPFATFHVFHRDLPQKNIGFWLKNDHRNHPEIGMFSLCNFEGDPVEEVQWEGGTLNAAQKENLFLYLRKFSLDRSDKLVSKMIPVDIVEGNLVLTNPRAGPRREPCERPFNTNKPRGAYATLAIGRMKLRAASGCASALNQGAAADVVSLVAAGELRLLDTRGMLPLILLNNHVRLRAELEEARRQGVNLRMELNLPLIGRDFTPLLQAVSQNCSASIVEALLDHGADPRVKSYGPSARTCFEWPEKLGSPPGISELLHRAAADDEFHPTQRLALSG